ncbi:MAG: MarC family protein [Wenzhouxiangella sp.]|jgi:multiple antibiotic resistance protein|nr:MarC family protein [Wenzhouxiangella sp.]
MPGLLEFFLLCFTSLFTMINPIGVIPLYLGATQAFDAAEAKRVAVRAVLTSALLLVSFAITGKAIFDFFSITIDSLRIVGGVLFFLMGFDMLQARAVRRREPEETDTHYATDVAITPLAIPMITGPGAITMVILLMKDAADLPHRVAFFSALFAVLALTLLILIAGKRIRAVLGENGNKVLMRLMGLIVMVIAVEFFFAGLIPKIQPLFA